MTIRRIFALLLIFSIVLALSACSENPQETEPAKQGRAYLYGETHSNPAIYDLEIRIWQDHYHNQGMRHLFLEFSYFTTAYLNLWMQAEDDTILLQLYENWEGTSIQIEETLEFFRAIKKTCPETVFHGTDVGHQYWNTGEQYLAYLEEQNLTDTEEYLRTVESIEQGKNYYCYGLSSSVRDDVYRENTMAANFIREFEALKGEDIMGIYGMAHVRMDSLNNTGECDSMGKQLVAHFGEVFTVEDLTRRMQLEAQPEKIETLTINKKDYEAEYFGLKPLSENYSNGYSQVEYWHLLNAHDAFMKAGFASGDVLHESNFPMDIEEGEAYVVKYGYPDGRSMIHYYLCVAYEGKLYAREVYSSKIK